MNYTIIPAALVITFIVILLFSLFSRRPLRGFGLFFLLIFLVSWSGSLWITPYGPLVWGISWIPIVITGLLFSFLIFALTPKAQSTEAENEPLIAAGFFFWILLIILIISIGFGYYRDYNLIV